MVGGFYLAIACVISATAAVKEYPYETVSILIFS